MPLLLCFPCESRCLSPPLLSPLWGTYLLDWPMPASPTSTPDPPVEGQTFLGVQDIPGHLNFDVSKLASFSPLLKFLPGQVAHHTLVTSQQPESPVLPLSPSEATPCPLFLSHRPRLPLLSLPRLLPLQELVCLSLPVLPTCYCVPPCATHTPSWRA